MKRHFKERTGIDFDKRTTVAKCLFDKTGLRDSNNWHTAVLKNPALDKACTTETYTPDPVKDLPDVGTHSTDDLIKGCGEP